MSKTLPLKRVQFLSSNRHQQVICKISSTTTTRRSIILGSTGAAFVAAASNSNASSDPRSLVRSGMQKFDSGNVQGSLQDFDAALIAQPSIRPYLWQRGLSLYYTEDFEEGARQFRDDVAVNPNDTEEAIWCYLCEAKLLNSPSEARKRFLKVGRDSRPVMRAAEEAFRTGCTTDIIAAAAGRDTQGHAAFYSLLYIALWYEAEGEQSAAKEAMLRAVETEYAEGSGDYMASLAKVHCKLRGWEL